MQFIANNIKNHCANSNYKLKINSQIIFTLYISFKKCHLKLNLQQLWYIKCNLQENDHILS